MSNARGQVLVLFALLLFFMVGVTALAIDVSRVYSEIRWERTVTDTAALAGGQELQVVGTRVVGPPEAVEARREALDLVGTQLGGSTAGCDQTADVADCPVAGTSYTVSVKTPYAGDARKIKVGLRHVDYPLTFAGVLGFHDFDIAIESVAGISYGRSYAIVTLRPPKKLGATFDVNDIVLNGNDTRVIVHNGDVGANANMKYSGVGAELVLDPGYLMYYFYPATPEWTGGPASEQLPALIPDPGYRVPVRTAATPTFADKAAATEPDPDKCNSETAKLDPDYGITTTTPNVYCYFPGIYTFPLDVPLGEVALLMPGVYLLDQGANVQNGGKLIGGFEAGKPGVSLVFKECSLPPGNGPGQCAWSAESATLISLNAGSAYPPGTGGSFATGAEGWDGVIAETSGPYSPNPALPLSVVVEPDPDCYVPTSAPFIEPSSCDAGKDKTLRLPGGGSLVVAGVQYAPTDNMTVTGGSATQGMFGQIISWTIEYSGNSTMNFLAQTTEQNGVLRLDVLCSPSAPCPP